MEIARLVEQEYDVYLSLLKQLVAMNTVLDNRPGIEQALAFCKKTLAASLKNYRFHFDKEHNLLGVPLHIDESQPLLYLSAHIDTVPANKEEWDPKYDPFVPFEDENEVVGRGVNDCKAGVAYQLFLAYLIALHYPDTQNIVFTFSAREEGGAGSSREIAVQLGKALPAPNPKLYLITLENNVTVEPPTLAINYGERGSIGIEVTTTLDVIRAFLLQDENEWNPTIIRPIEPNQTEVEELTQPGGHAATSARKDNKLYQLLTEPDIEHSTLEAGNPLLISAVPTKISKRLTETPIKHRVVFDLRTFKKVRELTSALDAQGFQYRFLKKLDNGFNVKEKIFADEIYPIIQGVTAFQIRPVYETNPGTTDTGTIYGNCDKSIQDKMIPLTIGPGCRSQRHKKPPRLSHGVNETFDKAVGLQAVQFISQVIFNMKFLQ